MDSGTERRLRQDFAIPDDVDLSLRPVATLGVQDGRPELRFADKDSETRFFDELDRLQAISAGGVRALSFAPHEELRALHGNRLWLHSRIYLVQWEGYGISDASAAYARRFIQIEKGLFGVPKDLKEKQISNEVGLGRAPLFLSPIELSLDDTRARASIAAGDDVWFLPPVRDVDQPERLRSYFSIGRQRVRALLRQVLDIDKPKPEEPVAVLVQRFIDDPALRDLLLEGGGLRIEGATGEATRVALEICECDEIARTRAGIVLGSLEGVPDWARALARELRRDVQSVVPGGLVRRSTNGSYTDWSIASGEMARPVTAEKGFWHRLAELEKRLRAQDQDRAKPLWDEVLRLSNPGDRYNHNEALQLFCKNFWRRPWEASPSPDDPWQRATVDLLNSEQFGAEAAPVRWAEQFDHTVTPSPTGLTVLCARSPSDEDVLYWRLLYPLGTSINAPGRLYLDRGDRSRLDTGLVLA